MRTAVDQPRARRSELAFSVIEVIVAAMLLVVALGGAIVIAQGSSHATTTSTVRQAQTAILASAAEKVRSDSSWTSNKPLTCGSVGQTTDITAWLRSRIARELLPDASRASTFVVTATARAVDSGADGRCPDDADGIVPDYYDIEVVARPDASTAARTPNAAPITQRFQVDFSSRTSGGKLSIQACYAYPQTDARIPTGSCDENGTGGMVILPPAQVPLDGTTLGTCAGGADCTAWTCAHPLLDAACESGQFGNDLFISVRPIAASGWSYTVTGADPNTRSEPVRTGRLDNSGSTTIDSMLPGRYQVRVNPPPAIVPWETHSVPASGIATVERGIRSRIVQMFRPAPRTKPLVVPIQSREITDPPWVGQPIVPRRVGGNVTYELVPAPLGRASNPSSVTVHPGDTFAQFDDVEPGLYAAKLRQSGGGYKDITDSAGFFFVPPGTGDPITLPTRPWRIQYDWCDAPRRERQYVDVYGEGTVIANPADPSETWKVTSCYSSGGGGGSGPPPPNPGGGGNA
ncbi:MAG: hypothetical protein JWM98_2226 [Thermoleophilia bacterium]|nr:hypothetical protein [Thermoleophilia bacterium]